jgi:hypothetical protein
MKLSAMFEKVSCGIFFPIISIIIIIIIIIIISSSSIAIIIIIIIISDSINSNAKTPKSKKFVIFLNRYFAYWARCRNSMPCHQVWVVSSH